MSDDSEQERRAWLDDTDSAELAGLLEVIADQHRLRDKWLLDGDEDAVREAARRLRCGEVEREGYPWTDEDVARRLEEAFREGFRTYPQTEGQELPAWHNSKTKAFVDSLEADPAPFSGERDPDGYNGPEIPEGVLWSVVAAMDEAWHAGYQQAREDAAPDAPQEDAEGEAEHLEKIISNRARSIEQGVTISFDKMDESVRKEIVSRLRRSERERDNG